MSNPHVTVMFATRNGGETLRQTLDGYCRLGPFRDWNMVVVDNGSTDDTPAILDEYKRLLPLTVYSERRAGKNVALNTGIRLQMAAGIGADLFVFTDDDAVPGPGYLRGWVQAARDAADCDLFGGLVRSEFTRRPPEWLSDCESRFAELFARNDRPEGHIEARHIFGPNMAIRGWLIQKGCRFDETIGPNGSSNYAMGSETEFCVRLEREHDLKAWFTRATEVQHLVRPWQMTTGFFAARAVRHGRGFAAQQIKAGCSAGLARMILVAAKGRCIHPIQMRVAKGKTQQEAIWQYHWWRGYMTERVSKLHSTKAPPGFLKRRALAVELAVRAALRLRVGPEAQIQQAA